MIQQVKAFVVKSDDMILISWTHIVKEETLLFTVVLWHVCHKEINEYNKLFSYKEPNSSESSSNNNNNDDNMLVFKPFSVNLLVVN